jgi:hypothetical protein
MDNVQNCVSYINKPSSETYRFHILPSFINLVSRLRIFHNVEISVVYMSPNAGT